MNPLEIMEARLAELRKESEALYDKRGALIDTAASEKRGFTDAEQAEYDAASTKRSEIEKEIGPVAERVAELREQAKREQAAAAARVETGNTGEQRSSAKVNEPDVYTKNGPNSYFRDLFMAQAHRDVAAEGRLQRHARFEAETRAMGNTNGAGGSGGEWAPPTWMTDDWINLIRPSRITADLFSHEDVPFGTSSLNYPKLLTGTAVGLQSTQNSALASTDATTGYVQVGFSTIGGKNVLSQQLIDQGRNFDQVILKDLAAAYGQQIGTQVFTGTGNGSGTNAVINGLGAATIGSTQTWTQASPTAAGFYGQAAALLAGFLNKRLAPPTHWVMNPRRWYWLAASTDNQGRPLVVPNGQAFNTMATIDNPATAMGVVGTFLGVPVVIDPLVPTNLGTGTNQDIVYLIKADDLVLLESGPKTEVFREPYADSLGVLVRLYGYAATILNRHSESIGVISGTGLVTPVFAS